MVRPNRVKRYSFQGTNITADANGLFDAFSKPVNGELRVVQVLSNTFADTGSLQLLISGTGETIWSLISGTDGGMVSSTGAYLPMAHARTTENKTLSGTAGNGVWTSFPMFGDLHLVGSGLGAAASGTEINIGYV